MSARVWYFGVHRAVCLVAGVLELAPCTSAPDILYLDQDQNKTNYSLLNQELYRFLRAS